ncbi:U3 small nucleolar RNA-associated protein 13 [Paramecium bursaria]
MKQFHQICSYKGHEQNKIKYVCLDPQCQNKRLICSQCLLDKFHMHDNETMHSYFDQKGLQAYIQQKINKVKKQQAEEQKIKNILVQKSIKLVDGIFLQLDSILENIKEFQQPSQEYDYIKSLETYLNNIKETKLRLIDYESVSQLVCKKYEQSRVQQIKDQRKMPINNKQYQKHKLIMGTLKVQKLKDINYDIIKLDQLTDNDIYTASISKDLKLIVSGGTDQILKIWNYSDYKFIKQYEYLSQVFISKFTDDSKFLYIGTSNGSLYCYDNDNDIKENFQKQIHSGGILNLYCITNYQVLTSSVDKTVIKTDILTKQQVFKIKAHEDSIYGLDYNKLKDLIVSCSYDKSIKLWKNNNGELVIENKNAINCQIKSILFINNNQLISLSDNINIWQINGKELISIKTIADNNQINNISLVLNQSQVLLICKNYLKFYTILGELVNTIKHDVKDFKLMRGVQLDSGKAIIIQGKKELKICRLEI